MSYFIWHDCNDISKRNTVSLLRQFEPRCLNFNEVITWSQYRIYFLFKSIFNLNYRLNRIYNPNWSSLMPNYRIWFGSVLSICIKYYMLNLAQSLKATYFQYRIGLKSIALEIKMGFYMYSMYQHKLKT